MITIVSNLILSCRSNAAQSMPIERVFVNVHTHTHTRAHTQTWRQQERTRVIGDFLFLFLKLHRMPVECIFMYVQIHTYTYYLTNILTHMPRPVASTLCHQVGAKGRARNKIFTIDTSETDVRPFTLFPVAQPSSLFPVKYNQRSKDVHVPTHTRTCRHTQTQMHTHTHSHQHRYTHTH